MCLQYKAAVRIIIKLDNVLVVFFVMVGMILFSQDYPVLNSMTIGLEMLEVLRLAGSPLSDVVDSTFHASEVVP